MRARILGRRCGRRPSAMPMPILPLKKFLSLCNCSAHSVHDGFSLGTNAAVVDWRGKDNAFCFFQQGVEFLHVIFEGAFFVFKTVIAVGTKSKRFATNSPEMGFKPFFLRAFLGLLLEHIPWLVFLGYHKFQLS